MIAAQEVTRVNKTSFVITLEELTLEVGKEYSFITSEDQFLQAKVALIKNGKALLKTDNLELVKKGMTLEIEPASTNDQEETHADETKIYKKKKHQFSLGLGTASLNAITLKDASGAVTSILDKASLFGFNIGYQYYLAEYFSLGGMAKFYGGDRRITDPDDGSSAEVDSNLFILNLFIAGHFKNFFLRIGYLPIYSFTLTENEDSVELEGSGTEIALGYLYMFNNSSHGISMELYAAGGEFDEITLKDGDTTILSGDLNQKEDQNAGGVAINWAFKF